MNSVKIIEESPIKNLSISFNLNKKILALKSTTSQTITKNSSLIANSLDNINELLHDSENIMEITLSQTKSNPEVTTKNPTTTQLTTANLSTTNSTTTQLITTTKSKIFKRFTQEVNIEPTKIADLSLQPITLAQPDYRNLNVETTTLPQTTTTKKSSLTIMSISDSSNSSAYNNKFKKSEAQQAEAQQTLTDFEIKQAEIEAATTISNNNLVLEATTLRSIIIETTPTITLAQPDYRNSTIIEPNILSFQDPNEYLSLIKLLSDTVANSTNLLFQNITLIMPNYNPNSTNKFFDSLFQNRQQLYNTGL